MHGILDLDVLCLTEIFKFLNPLDLCSLRQSCTQLRDFVEDHFRYLYFTREQWLDLTGENIGDVSRILKNFGKDLKPQNILLRSSDGRSLLKIADGWKNAHTPTGTEGYWAPEVSSGVYDLKVDVYSLGVILHRSMSGNYPLYFTENLVLNGQPCVRTPEACRLLKSMLAKDPAESVNIGEIVKDIWLQQSIEDSNEAKKIIDGERVLMERSSTRL